MIVSTAEPEPREPFFASLLDDYFAECDEHLSSMRRNLLALEKFVGQRSPDAQALEVLFRSFHSLKGISGMVGLVEAEQIAHQLEEYLRVLRQGQAALAPEGMDGLIAGVQMLERVISAHRVRQPLPAIDELLAQLAALVPKIAPVTQPDAPASFSTSLVLSEEEQRRLANARKQGARIWRFTFVPSVQLSERGINVNSIRARLQAIGEMIRAAPQVRPNGGIAFEFIVATSADERSFSEWREDGLTFAPYETGDAVEPVPERAAPVETHLPAAPADLDSQTAPAMSPGTSAKSNQAKSATANPAMKLTDGNGRQADLSASLIAPSHVVRVDLGRLDELMRIVGELVMSRSHLEDHLERLEASCPAPMWRALQETSQVMERHLRGLHEGVMRLRLVPVGEIFERMPFVVRDLARESGKKVNLELSGRETEIDKYLVERMMDPLLHLVRNAVSHGLEPAGERIARGKPAEGRIMLRASAMGEAVMIEIEDDGRGIDARRVAARAGLAGGAPGWTPDSDELLDLICAPGFSTREEADRASGRGVGMTVVRNTVLDLGGTLSLETEEGRGSCFTIQLPLTLAIADALIVSVGSERFAIPQASVREVMAVEAASVRRLENNEIIPYRGGVLPLVQLARFFGMKGEERDCFHVFVIGRGLSAVGIGVDRILGQREIVVRAMADPLIKVPGIAGATELGDGRLILILNAMELTKRV